MAKLEKEPKIKKKPAVKKPSSKKNVPLKKAVDKENIKKITENLPNVLTTGKSVGAPCKIDSHREEILNNIRNHFMKEYGAAQAAGITKNTFLNWKNAAAKALEEEREDDKYLVFFGQIQLAKQEAIKKLTTQWAQHTPNDWRACKELVEKLDPETWVIKQHIDVTSNGESLGKPIFLPLKDDE